MNKHFYWFLYILVCVLVLSCTSFSLAENQDSELIYNGDFSFYSDNALLPAGWDFVSYIDDPEYVYYGFVPEEDEERCHVLIENYESNDSRITQTIYVEPDTVYHLSCRISTTDVEGDLGATISVDNYAYDGTYCYSEPLFGSNDWQLVDLYVKSGPAQDQFTVALRLGGYSMEASGTARFSSVSVVESDESARYLDITKETGVSSYFHASEETSHSISDADTGTSLVKIILITLLTGILLCTLYIRVLRYGFVAVENMRFHENVLLCGASCLAIIIRLILSLVFVGHTTDINCFMAWGNAVYSNGPSQFYTSGMFADYPPLYMLVCGGLSGLANFLHFGYGSAGYVFLFKLPATVADIICGLLIYRLSVKQNISRPFSFVLASLFLFNPATMFVSGAWGQIDSILSLGILSVLLVLPKNRIVAGVLYGLTVLLKPQALMFGPLIALLYFLDVYDDCLPKRILLAFLSALSAVVVIFIVSLPFKGSQNYLWIVDKYASTAGSYQYASIEAFNFPALVGGNWKPVDSLFLGISFKTWGIVSIALSIVFSFFVLIRGYKNHKSAPYIASSMLIAMIFSFGHYMHERYLFPVLLLLLVGYIYERDRRLLLIFIFYTVCISFNAYSAMYIVDHQSARTGLYEVMTFLGSAAEVATTLYLIVISIQILVLNKVVGHQEMQQRKSLIRENKATASELEPDATTKPVFTKKDYIALGSLILVYAVVSILNLGTLHAPETFWETETLGETIHVMFPENVHLSGFRVYSNIGNNGSVLVVTEDGGQAFYEQKYDDMFRWSDVDLDSVTHSAEITLYSGSVKINEIAFYDSDDNLVPIELVGPKGNQAFLFDEQNTVVSMPSYFNGMYFDELYHGRTAYEHLHNLTPYENSHPPLGKLFIMLGIICFGMTPFGWRIAGTLFGIGMIPIMYLFGKRMFKNRWDYSFVMSFLFAFDFMHFTQTRIATIDVYAVFFILLMFYYMYQYICMNFFVNNLRQTLKPLALSGVFFGLGAASKWISFYAGAGLAVLFFHSILKRFLEYRRATHSADPVLKRRVAVFWHHLLITLVWCVLFFILIPFLIYFLSYIPYFRYEAGEYGMYSLKDAFETFFRYQKFMFDYHSKLTATHPYQSSFWQWPFTMKPMWYYFGGIVNNTISTLSASGNPFVWWICSIGAIALFIFRLSGKTGKDACNRIFLVGTLANYLPWFAVTRCTFIYHFFATVPFILMATVFLLYLIENKYSRLSWVKWVWIALALASFILLYPGLSGLRIPLPWASILKLLPGGKLMYGV